ncbi:MAG: hypothetical protein IJQ80_05195, partial [Clostridia bacterium]|nr:hypothetical protein [Clostridia bacterium]
RYDYVEETVDRVNAARASVGASALTLSPTLTEAAMKRAEECAVYYGHIRPSGYSCFTLVNNTGIYPSGLAILENIACSRGTPESVMSAWIGSPAHYKNIISSRPTQIGIGCFYNNGYAYWAQVFGTGKETGDLPYDCAVECSATFETLESHLTERGDADSVEVTMCTGVKLDVMMRNLGIDQNFTFYSQMRPVQSAICDQSGSAIAVIDATGTCYGLKEGTGTFSLAIYEGDRFASEVAITVTAHRMPDSYSMSTPPTYTSPGVAVKICPLCGGVAETIEIPRLISTVPGDVDGDGLVTAKDVLRMRKTIAGLDTIDETYFANGDFDGDGDVTMKDVLRVRKIIAGVD